MITAPDITKIAEIGDYMSYVPYEVTRKTLYDARSLYGEKLAADCYDNRVYQHYLKTGKHAFSSMEMLARSLHDFSVQRALDEFLVGYDQRRIIGVMGGHGLRRTDKMFREIVLLSRELTMRGSLMVSGGGPGAMEATHLGAWLAGRNLEEVEDALDMLCVAPCFRDEGWLETAFEVMEKYPQKDFKSLGIPTWLYGHEPSTPFATHIAKFFENSIREDRILTIAFGGIIFTPGSAGTLQEIFQEAVQDHYLSYGFASPMIFLGRQFWDEEIPVYPFMEHMVETGQYKNMILSLTDSADDVVQELLRFRNDVIK